MHSAATEGNEWRGGKADSDAHVPNGCVLGLVRGTVGAEGGVQGFGRLGGELRHVCRVAENVREIRVLWVIDEVAKFPALPGFVPVVGAFHK